MANVSASNVVDYGFVSWSGQIKYYKIGFGYFFVQHTLLRSKSKDGSARNQDDVSEWSDMSTRGLLFQ